MFVNRTIPSSLPTYTKTVWLNCWNPEGVFLQTVINMWLKFQIQFGHS